MDQPSLFDQDDKEDIHLPDGDIVYLPRWLSRSDTLARFGLEPEPRAMAQKILEELQQQTPWEQSDIVLYGKRMKIPRLNAWYGDKECHYQYSGTRFEPQPWTPLLLVIKDAIEHALYDYLGGVRFNSALVNCYRDGDDSVAWHSDDEPELGKNPVVASLSLGQERVFQLRHKASVASLSSSASISRTPLSPENTHHRFILRDGDLLLMYGPTQHYWQHQIPKTTQAVGQRINITFRYVAY